MQEVLNRKTNGQPLQSNNKEMLTNGQLKRVSDFIGNVVGIQLPESKRTLVEGRLRKRLRELGFDNFKTYLDHTLNTDAGDAEKLQLIDVITTNKTNFYREAEHFDYLINSAIPDLDEHSLKNNRRELNVWSAGCSTGEEAYTLSIELNELMSKRSDFNFKILATDISHSCLRTGSHGVYTERQTEIVPMEFKRKYFLRSKNSKEALVQMGAELKSRIKFKSLNLKEPVFSLPNKMDIIFCRNVMIYFDNKMREELVAKFESNLIQGGYLFVGHSESLNGIDTTLKQVSPMVYKKL